MNHNEMLQGQLDLLGNEIGSSSELVQRVMSLLENRPPINAKGRKAHFRVALNTKVGLTAAAMIVLCAFAWWLSRPTNVYAKMLQAFSTAKTVHITGWTRIIGRKWPLENPSNGRQDAVPLKHPIEMWHWSEQDGTPRSYERQGPVVVVRQGGDSREYQEDVDLMYVYAGGYSKDKVSEFSQLAQYLELLQRPSLKKRELGKCNVNGRVLRGIRHVEGNRIEDLWIDEASGLPQRLTRVKQDTGEQTFELLFAVNQQIPEEIATYEPPSTKNVRYGGQQQNTNLAWRQYVQEMGVRLSDSPINSPVALLPRENGKTFANQWTLQTPDAKYWIMPLDRDQYQQIDLWHFVRNQAATEDGERRHGTWRVPKEFHDFIIPRSDLVYEDGTPWREWMLVVLSQFDLELVDEKEDRTVWVAKHDGRELKPWQDVHPPVAYVVEGGVEKKGNVRPGIGYKLRPVTLQELFGDFNRLIDSGDFTADKPWIVDETRLPQPPMYNESEHGSHKEYREKVVQPKYLVATDSPWFVGRKSLQMARDWYRKEFGITFEKIQESVTVHVIRRKL